MNKLATALLAVAFLARPASGADQPSKDAAKTTRDPQAAEGSQQAHATKKARKAKKDPINTTKPLAPKTETKPTAEPAPSR